MSTSQAFRRLSPRRLAARSPSSPLLLHPHMAVQNLQQPPEGGVLEEHAEVGAVADGEGFLDDGGALGGGEVHLAGLGGVAVARSADLFGERRIALA